MKDKRLILTTVILSGGIAFGAQSIFAQSQPDTSKKGLSIPERMQSPKPADPNQGQSQVSADDIKKAKEVLKAKGIDPGPINGTMDAKTQQALRQFQKANNLPVTGTLDRQTAAKLGLSVGSTGGKGSSREGGPQPCRPKGK